jgi:Family of unknown function (DUF1028)/Invasin, domain 3
MIALLIAGPVCATWSIIIVDLATGEIAIGSATCLTTFDLLQLSPVMIVGVGGAAAQSYIDIGAVNRAFIRDQLLLGTPPAQILAMLAMLDPGHQTRQYGIVDTLGGFVSFTGTSAGLYAGQVTGQAGTLRYAIQGNVLTGQPVILMAEQAILTTPGDLAAKLMAAMQAARAMGGDGRCSCAPFNPTGCGSPPASFTKSAHIGYMVVARPGDVDGPCAAAPGCAAGAYYLKHNIAYQTAGAADPVIQLQTLFNTWRSSWTGRPDHFLSTVSFNPPDLPADGITQTFATVQLKDWQGTNVGGTGAAVSVTLAPSSTAAVQIGAVTALGGGAYGFPVTAGTAAGAASFDVVVNDGQGPVLLWPRPQLSVTANPLWASAPQLSAAAGGTVSFVLRPGVAFANRSYVLGLSGSGSVPGIQVSPTVVIPLNPDPILFLSLSLANSPSLPGSMGQFDASGRATAQLVAPPGVATSLQGSSLTAAFATTNPIDFASNAVTIAVVP